MIINNEHRKLPQRAAFTLLYFALFSASFSAAANVSQAPLSLTEGVSPNMILTLDESGSMSWGHIPDNQPWDSKTWKYDSRRYRAANLNPMYYNPNIIYEIPPAFDSSGTEYSLSTSFTDAPVNGFLPSGTRGKIDLSSDYLVVREFRMPDGTFNRADHPDDFYCQVSVTERSPSASCGVNDGKRIKIDIERTSSSPRCKATATLGSITWNPACSRSYGSNTATVDMREQGVRAYYYEFDPTLDNGACAAKRNNLDGGGEDCYRLRLVDQNSAYDSSGSRLTHSDGSPVDGRQNFAIWYSFYKTRALATLSAASIAFYDLSSDVRFTWQDLATCRVFDGSSPTYCRNNALKPYSSQHKGEFYTWLRQVYFNVGTPLPAAMQRVGEYLKTDTPWQYNPGGSGNTAENTYACRSSYHVLMTDGMWNTRRTMTHTRSGTTWTNTYSNRSITFPSNNTDDTMAAPYGDSTSNTLADLAMHYWATDLRPGLANKVPKYMPFRSAGEDDPRNNPADWQHMTNFIMGLGLSSVLNDTNVPWAGSTHAGAGYDKLKAGTASWPTAGTTSDGGTGGYQGRDENAYDLWHAAINSRGEFYSVDSPSAMVQAFKDILERIADRKSTASRPAINSGMEDDGTGTNFVRYLYQTSYASDENWAGDLKRIKREQPAGAAPTETQMWSAQSLLNAKAPNSRNIKIAASSGGTGLQDFTWSNISSGADIPGTLAHALQRNPETAAVENASAAQDRLNFIRGVRTGEGTTYRQRMHVLGDMYSSTPAIVSGPRYLESFANRLEDSTAYTTFINTITDRTNPNPDARQPRSPRVYVGANDGMLHAFNANTGDETFAFIPTAVFPKLNKLTGSNYSHEFYVDGSPVVADVYFGSEWRTILVGTLRAGGKSIFALDITTPGAEKLLWEFDESDITGVNAVKPGFSFSKPTIARLHNGKWAVVTGNGYEGANTADGKAALYIIDAETGDLTKSLEVQGATGIKNGLSTPRLADYNSDGIADYAYAGDLQGNLWRFDLLGSGADPARASGSIYGNDKSNTDNFRVSYGGQPMFTATSTAGSARQPITAPPSLIRHPTRTGYLVVFGTGKYFETTDKDGVKTHAQSVYGIWDRSTKAETTSAGTISRSNLVSQEITDTVVATADSGATRTARTISNNPISWYTADGAVDKWGWRLDLAIGTSYQGEMVIEDMSALGQTIFFQSLVPNDDPCASGSSNWTYAINPFTGGKTNHHPFDYKGTGDTVVSAIQQAGEGGFTVSQTPDGQYELSTGSESVRIYADPTSIGRQSWRIVGSQ